HAGPASTVPSRATRVRITGPLHKRRHEVAHHLQRLVDVREAVLTLPRPLRDVGTEPERDQDPGAVAFQPDDAKADPRGVIWRSGCLPPDRSIHAQRLLSSDSSLGLDNLAEHQKDRLLTIHDRRGQPRGERQAILAKGKGQEPGPNGAEWAPPLGRNERRGE